jgi:glutamate 5-kinase
LLSAGVLKVEGQFKRGETISILNQNNEELARAIAKYNNEDLDKIKGKQSDEITEILGYFYGAVAVHRNDLILLG